MSDELTLYINTVTDKVERFLDSYLEVRGDLSDRLIESERYSVLGGGKRVRALLLYATYNIFRDKLDDAIPFASAVEMVHAYSLIHDDLPAMDDDDIRRGKPTNHKVYGEAVAILAGDGLLTRAFELITDTRFGKDIDAKSRIDVVNILAKAIGDNGMVAGQTADILSEELVDFSEDRVKYIHSKKTGALITASIVIGGKLAGADDKQLSYLKRYADNIGLAFQIVDDLLDISSTSDELGKSVGKDIAQSKATYPALFGIERSKEILSTLLQDSKEALSYFGEDSRYLELLAEFIVNRKK